MPRADCATYDSAITEARANWSRAVSSSMSSSGWNPQIGASIARPACTSTRTSPLWIGSGDGSGGGRGGGEFPSPRQSPTPAERGVLRDEIFDVDTEVAQGTTVLIRLGDLGGKCHHTLESGNEILRDLVRDDSHGGIVPRGGV